MTRITLKINGHVRDQCDVDPSEGRVTAIMRKIQGRLVTVEVEHDTPPEPIITAPTFPLELPDKPTP